MSTLCNITLKVIGKPSDLRFIRRFIEDNFGYAKVSRDNGCGCTIEFTCDDCFPELLMNEMVQSLEYIHDFVGICLCTNWSIRSSMFYTCYGTLMEIGETPIWYED